MALRHGSTETEVSIKVMKAGNFWDEVSWWKGESKVLGKLQNVSASWIIKYFVIKLIRMKMSRFTISNVCSQTDPKLCHIRNFYRLCEAILFENGVRKCKYIIRDPTKSETKKETKNLWDCFSRRCHRHMHRPASPKNQKEKNINFRENFSGLSFHCDRAQLASPETLIAFLGSRWKVSKVVI